MRASDGKEVGVAKGEQMRLSSFLKTLGDELRDAAKTAAAEEGGPILDIAECELELGLTWEAQGSAGANFYVFRLGGGGQRTQTQTIRLRLTPSELSPAPPPPPDQPTKKDEFLVGFPAQVAGRRGTGVVRTDKGAKA